MIKVEYRIGKTVLQRWVSTVRKYGYEALEPSKRRGRPPKSLMGQSKEERTANRTWEVSDWKSPSEGRERAAKKAKALVEAKKAQALLNGREPSTN